MNTTTAVRPVPILWGDLETYSTVPIAHGIHAYAEHAELLLFSYAIGDGPVTVWDCTATAEMPPHLAAALNDPAILLYFHNSQFDRTLLKRHGIQVPLERWRDSMVQALAHSLPGALSTLCEIFRIPVEQAKAAAGKRLIQLFCKPLPAHYKLRRATRATHPVKWSEFIDYARLDVAAMRAIEKCLPCWNYPQLELAAWHLDQTINDRGFLVDTELAQAAIRAVEHAKATLATRTTVLTHGAVQAATQRDALLHYLADVHQLVLPDMQQSTLEQLRNNPALSDTVREIIAIRLQASATSTAKYATLLNAVSSDGRLRGALQFNGASRTGRWAGRLFQPQNLPRPTLSPTMIEHGIKAMKAGYEELLFSDVMALASNTLRSCLIAPKDKQLIVADLANIEGRVLAWLAGEKTKLQAFRDFDTCKGVDGCWYTGAAITRSAFHRTPIALQRDADNTLQRHGHDIYKLAYANSFGTDPARVTKEQRHIGKVQELALGYGGGVGAFATFAALYQIDLEAMAAQARASLPPLLLDEAVGFLEWSKEQQRDTYQLSDCAWLVCDVFKRAWRNAHPAITSFWKELQTAAIGAIEHPETVYTCRLITLRYSQAWLRIYLPSGRALYFLAPCIDENGTLSYMGTHPVTRKWMRITTYGGKLAENITQAVSRDVLAACMPAIEAAGYSIVLTVHDEIITEADNATTFSAEHLAALMTTPPPWADGLPLAAEGFAADRYRKY
ncbi:DNA polymerase [Xylella fastidiosa subsp. sandyi]|uniref:DNA polymerase n=1 Tax=Xylella fastidiosa TaxID=2371 RepID=UPI000FFF0888|nr:DNA polymerase [Xylella fastidiosa]RWA44039.1 DNA polymerase [Xylella fastidiosa subsp. sandyi]